MKERQSAALVTKAIVERGQETELIVTQPF